MPAPLSSDITQEESEADMEFSDRELRSVSKTVIKSTHALLTDDSEVEVVNFGNDRGSENEDESRYSRGRVNKQMGHSRRITNRFETLEAQPVEYVISSSDEEAVNETSNQPTSHINKKRQLEVTSPHPGQIRRNSKRAFWASKATPISE
jgi:hypothetical protein